MICNITGCHVYYFLFRWIHIISVLLDLIDIVIVNFVFVLKLQQLLNRNSNIYKTSSSLRGIGLRDIAKNIDLKRKSDAIFNWSYTAIN